MLGWATGWSTPVTITVCATFQFADVKVSDAGATVPSVGSLDDKGIVTFAVGCVLSTTVKVAAPPASVVTRPATGATVMPAASSSVLVTATSAAFMLL